MNDEQSAGKERRLGLVERRCEQLSKEMEHFQQQLAATEASLPKMDEQLKSQVLSTVSNRSESISPAFAQFVTMDEFNDLVHRVDNCEDQILNFQDGSNDDIPQVTPPASWPREADKVIESMLKREASSIPTLPPQPTMTMLSPTTPMLTSNSDAQGLRGDTVQCQFCLRRIPRLSLATHLDKCELRMESCQQCGSKVLAMKMQKHLQTCRKHL